MLTQELKGANSVGYMTTHTTSHSIGYGIATTTWCNSPKDGDNGHTQTIEEVQQQFHQQNLQVQPQTKGLLVTDVIKPTYHDICNIAHITIIHEGQPTHAT